MNQKLKCPHCRGLAEYRREEIRVFITCKVCNRAFRLNECSPLTGKPMADLPRYRRGRVLSPEDLAARVKGGELKPPTAAPSSKSPRSKA